MHLFSTVATAACPWVGSSFSRAHPRTRKAYGILPHLKNDTLPIYYAYKLIKSISLNFAENSAELRVKYRLRPAQEKQFISCSTQFLNRTHQRNNRHNVQIITFRPNSYVEGKTDIQDIQRIIRLLNNYKTLKEILEI